MTTPRREALAPICARSHVALLRGINVGGRNIVRMADLRAAFEDAGYAAVRRGWLPGTR